MSTILVVDDEQSFRVLLLEALSGAGYTVLLANNGNDALKLASEHDGEIPLVITDFTMPGVSGIEVLRTLRETRPGIRGILLSGHWIHPVPEDLNAVYLMKPCSISRLLATVRDLLAGAESKSGGA